MSDIPRKTFTPKIPNKKRKKKPITTPHEMSRADPGSSAPDKVGPAVPSSSSTLNQVSNASASASKRKPFRGSAKDRKGGINISGRSKPYRDQYTRKDEGIFSHGFQAGGGALQPVLKSSSSSAGPPEINLHGSNRYASGVSISRNSVQQSSSSLKSSTRNRNHSDDLDITKEEHAYEGKWYHDTEPRFRPTFLPLGTTVMEDDKDRTIKIEQVDSKPNMRVLTLSPQERERLDQSSASPFINTKQQLPEMLLLKFPDPLPFNLPQGTADSNLNTPANVKSEQIDTTKQFTESNLQSLPGGSIGRMKVYKSGRMEICIGGVSFDVVSGTKSTFAQEVVCIDSTSQYPTTTCLGALRQRYAVIPEIQRLLENTHL